MPVQHLVELGLLFTYDGRASILHMAFVHPSSRAPSKPPRMSPRAGAVQISAVDICSEPVVQLSVRLGQKTDLDIRGGPTCGHCLWQRMRQLCIDLPMHPARALDCHQRKAHFPVCAVDIALYQ